MINWKLRLQNKATLLTLLTTIIAFCYQLFAIFGYAPSISQSTFVSLAGMIVTVLAALGICVDPTTEGIGDSAQALTYEEPKKSE